MSLKNTAQETLKILQAGQYINSLGNIVDFAAEQQAAEAGTKLYTPEGLANLSDRFTINNKNKLSVSTTAISICF